MKNSVPPNKRGPFAGMAIPTIVMAVIAIVLFILGYQQNEGIEGLKAGGTIFLEIIPLLVFAMVVAGMVQVLIPARLISRWVGTESGIRGILIGTFIGGIMPGGPFVSMPIAAGLLRAGAGVGTMVAFIVSWSLLAISRLPLEIGIMGWQFVAIRLACVFFMPVIAGIIASTFFGKVALFGRESEYEKEARK